MKLIDGSILVWKEYGKAWAFSRGREFVTYPKTTPLVHSSFEYEYLRDGWEVYWLPEGLL